MLKSRSDVGCSWVGVSITVGKGDFLNSSSTLAKNSIYEIKLKHREGTNNLAF